MRRALPVLLLAALAVWGAEPNTGAPPSIDKVKLERYIRYAEAFVNGVHISVGDPGKTASPELWVLPVHVTSGDQSLDMTYYLTADGQELVGGKLWYLAESPFADVLKQLPTEGPSFGPADAKVTMTVFSDFECPYCRQLAQTIRQNIPKLYPTQVRVVFIDFPLQQIHPWAYAMAQAARCVADGHDDRFWALHDWIFEHQQEITKENLKDKVLGYAKDHGLDTASIGTCIDNHATQAAVDRDIAFGKRLHLDQTPVVFVNGRMLGGAQKWDTLDAVIKLDLDRSQELSDSVAGKTH